MKFIIKYNEKPVFDFEYLNLAQMMWTPSFRGEPLEISHTDNDSLNQGYYLALSWNKWLNDKRWRKSSFNSEYIMMNEIRKPEGTSLHLYVSTDHVEIPTVDQRALYRLIYKITSDFGALISDDEGVSWENPELFKSKHRLAMNLKMNLANKISLLEQDTLSQEKEEDRDDLIYII